MTPKDQAYYKISQLVERFEEQYASYKKTEYNETMTRRDFIDPFFKALGWDVDNENGNAESYREVIHEDRIKIGGRTKAPDYSFKLAGSSTRLFFVEAKKPSVVIKDDMVPAYQLRRYGWNAKLAVSIVTDFEEFAIYDCTKKPNQTDKATVARIKYLTFRDYLKEFDFIWDTFSKERVLKGSFDKFTQGAANRKGTETVDKDFLLSLDKWRMYLATSIGLKNKHLGEDELNFVVQQTIDRLIFLRIAEDRNVEPYGSLQMAVKQGDVYQNLFSLFKEADDKYNSGLFDFKKDLISKDLKVDNKVLKNIVNELYAPVSHYEFAILPLEILGSAYEQFLGKQIKIDSAHKAYIEEKPEVRKAGGVYYTPQYVVDYIVQNTVGQLIKHQTPDEVSSIKIVDPACGSGSFLIGAYRFLLDWHRDYYHEQAKHSKIKKGIPLTPEGNLTTAEKKRILLNNIYGVDLDVNAVEVTKLSLLLKCLEGETSASIAHQKSMFNEKVLPTLDNNIKDGNSLVDEDYYGNELDFGGEVKKIKPFSWKSAFPEVFKEAKRVIDPEYKNQYLKVKGLAEETDKLINRLKDDRVEEPMIKYGIQGGFDVVIGNPPYLGGRDWKIENGNVYNYFIKRYQVAEYQFDIYALFWELGVRLLKPNGLIGYITPNTWLNNQSNKKLRAYILEKTTISKIVDYSKVKVFDQATVLPIITILENKATNNSTTEIFEPYEEGYRLINFANQNIWRDDDLNIININLNTSDLAIRDKIEMDTEPLEKLALVKRGVQLYETGKGTPKQKAEDAKNKIYESDSRIDASWIKFLEGKDVNRYSFVWKNRWVKYGSNLAAPRDPVLFEGERIAVRRIVGQTLISTYLSDKMALSQLLHIVKPSEPTISKFLLAIINSKLMAFYFRKKYNRNDITFPEIRIYELGSLPIKKVDEKTKPIQVELTKLVDQLLQLNEEKMGVVLQTKISQLDGMIRYCEDKINAFVYQLYGLTEFDINIIEGK